MSAILFAPHGDDETLFAFYTLLRFKPHVVVVYYSDERRQLETAKAMQIAGVGWTPWHFREHVFHDEDSKRQRAEMEKAIADAIEGHDIVIAPAWEEGGHEHHNLVGKIVTSSVNYGLLGPGLIRYTTYRRGYGRTEAGHEIIPTSAERELKQKALRCYESQIDREVTRVWFGDDQREFVL